jgi:hypothetical protein
VAKPAKSNVKMSSTGDTRFSLSVVFTKCSTNCGLRKYRTNFR